MKYQGVGAFWASRRKCLRRRCLMWKPSRRSSEHGRCSQLVVVSPWLLLETWPAGEDPSASWGPAATCVAWEWVESIPKYASWLPDGCSIGFLWLLILLVLERKQQTTNGIRQERLTNRNVAPCWYSFAEQQHVGTHCFHAGGGEFLWTVFHNAQIKKLKSQVNCQVKCSVYQVSCHICIVAKIIQCHGNPDPSNIGSLLFRDTEINTVKSFSQRVLCISWREKNLQNNKAHLYRPN